MSYFRTLEKPRAATNRLKNSVQHAGMVSDKQSTHIEAELYSSRPCLPVNPLAVWSARLEKAKF